MPSTRTAMWQLCCCMALAVVGERAGWCQVPPSDNAQYQWDDIVVPAASGQEPVRGNVSLELARDYVERAALAWSKTRKCVSCHWPPLESSSFHATTVAAMAAAAAPNWLDALQDADLSSGVQRMLRYLRETKPAHDYDRVLLLWTSTRLVDLLNEQQRDAIVAMIWQLQRPDGGWSIRSFAQPETWGSGNRAEKLRGEPEFSDPPSDGHQTGLVVLVLRDAGVPADDPRLQKAVQWLQANQRASGRWWTRSLNTDRFHFITYSGTLYPLLALHKCGALPAGEK